MPVLAIDNSRPCDADPVEVRRAMGILFGPGERRELRALPLARSRVINSNEIDEAVTVAVGMSDQQVYWTLNPIQDGATRANKQTVIRRSWFLIDVDPIRPKDLSATEQEKENAGTVANAILAHLVYERGWPAPVMVDSGNGWHLLFKVDLPNDKLSQQILRDAIYHLAAKFDNEHATVDKSTHDAPRISKLPGTTAKKGPDTKDRPHRIAKLVFVPDAIEVVDIELIQELGKKEDRPPRLIASEGGGYTNYVNRAIEGECGKVALSTQGVRNIALNNAAFALGTMADWPEMRAADAKEALRRVAIGNGLTEREVAATIESGWNAGKAEPREKPERLGANPAKPAIPADVRLCVRASEIRPKIVEWLWPNRVAVGFITLFAGRTGVGKSFVLCDFVAKLTTGRPLPDAQNGKPPANVLIISEDPYDYVLAPRLKEMEADLDRVSFLTWDAMAAYTLADVAMLDRAYIEADSPLLIAIDPPANFLGGKADEHKNSEVRQILMNIVAWLNTKSVACIMITHVNKQVGKGVEAVDRIMGSVAWASTSRVALGFAPDPKVPNQCLFAGIKNNLGPKAKTLAYEIKTTDSLAVVDWRGEVDTTADEAFNNSGKQSVSESIEAWMEDRFREKRAWLQKDLKDYAMVSGFSFNAFKTYKRGVRKHQVPNDAGEAPWVWEAVYGWPPEIASEPPESPECAHLSVSGERENPHSDKNSDIRISRITPHSAGSGGSAHSDGGVGPECGPELAAAIRWLSAMLTGHPVHRTQFHELGNSLLMDSSTLDQAAEVLKVERTFEDGVEMWSLP